MCTIMTSALKGLQALVSETGYKHYDRRTLTKSAKQGCPLCTMLRSYQRVRQDDQFTRLFAELERLISDCKNTALEHSLKNNRIKHLRVNSPVGGALFGYEMRIFTTLGENLSNQTSFLCICLIRAK